MAHRPIRVLYVNGGLMDRGGVSSVMMSYYLKFDPEKIHVDFVVHGKAEGERDKEILSRGSHIFNVTPKSQNPVRNYFELKKIMTEGNYDIVHAHADSGNALILKIAKLCNIKVRISHSHNTNYTISNKFRIFLNNIQKNQITRYATAQWACSRLAGEWLYGIESKFEVIPNAIDTSRFAYNVNIRESIRSEYGLENKIIIGHIGRFDFQKNQEFLLDSFYKAEKKNADLMLVFIGDGKDRSLIESKIEQLGLQDKVVIMGQRRDVDSLINVFDVFAFPSRFEGLGIVVVEAQTNGLHCIVSDQVPSETNLTGNVEFLPLNSSTWVEELLKPYYRDPDAREKVINCGYDINSAANLVQNKYIEMVN